MNTLYISITVAAMDGSDGPKPPAIAPASTEVEIYIYIYFLNFKITFLWIIMNIFKIKLYTL